MERKFILSCESTVDLPYSYLEQRGIPVLFYSYMIGEETYIDDMGRDPEALPNFYRRIDEGAMPTTTQLNEFQYEEFFAPLLERGDVLHINFGSGMTSSVNNARLAAETLRERYPESTRSAPPPATGCSSITPPTCATRARRLRRPPTG